MYDLNLETLFTFSTQTSVSMLNTCSTAESILTGVLY